MSAESTSGALQGGIAGAATGAKAGSAGGPWGTAIGAIVGGAVGTIGGAILGKKKKKSVTPKFASGAVYGYDTYGNLVNKGTYSYNPATGQYELRAGELSGTEKAMRQNLAGNIANLINTVGTTPDAFVRYAKELSDSYYKQGERKLAENVATEQARLDESLARRGLSTSRAAADVQSEFERRRQNTLADIYDASQRYGYTVQSGLQGQANQAMTTLTGYQGQLMGQDQTYLQQALAAQAQGQAYENLKAKYQNAQIAQENQNWQNVLDALTSAGMSYAGGSSNATPIDANINSSADTSWMSAGTARAFNENPNRYISTASLSSPNQLSSFYNYTPFGGDYSSFINF